jgi:hypothetical protein
MPIFGPEGKAYMSLCEAHREGRVFKAKEWAREHAQRHNDAQHDGRAPRFRTFKGEDSAHDGR